MITEQIKGYLAYCAKNGLKPQDFKNLQRYLNQPKVN